MEGEILSCVCDVRQTKVKHARSGTQRVILRPVLVLSVQGLEVWAFVRQHQYHTSFRMSVTSRCKTWILQSGTTLCVYLHMTTPVILWPIQSLLSCIIIADLSYVRIFQVVGANMQFVCTFECTCMHMYNVCMQHMCLWNSTIISNLLDCVCSKEDSNATEICCNGYVQTYGVNHRAYYGATGGLCCHSYNNIAYHSRLTVAM